MPHDTKLNLGLLPFDVLTLIVPYIGILDIARLRLVSKDFYRCFADDELCRHALKRLVPSAPESQVLDPSRADFDRLVGRYTRWTRKKPSKIELITAAKGTASGEPGAWGVAGDLLIYQSPFPIKDVSDRFFPSSQLVIHDLRNERKDINVPLGSLDDTFRVRDSDERNKWKIWIPRVPAKGDGFISGSAGRPSHILVSTVYCAPARSVIGRLPGSNEPAPSQMLAVISLNESSLGKVVCHWRSEEEITFLALNNHYIAYVTNQSPTKYRIASVPAASAPTVHWKCNEVPYVFKKFTFSEKSEISSFGADTSGEYVFVGFGYKHHCFQVLNRSNGGCLKKIILSTPALEEYVSLRFVQPTYEFSHAVEKGDWASSSYCIDTELTCRYDDTRSEVSDAERPLTMALWKISVRFSEPNSVEDVKVETSFVGANPARVISKLSAELPSIDEQTRCLGVACTRVPLRAREQKRSFWKDYSNLPFLISTLYASEPVEDSTEDKETAGDGGSTETEAAPTWLRPVSNFEIPTTTSADLNAGFRARRTSEPSKARGTEESLGIPAPTTNNCPIHIGPGWMVFAKNRSLPSNAMNLFGRLVACRPDELVIVRFD